VLEQLRLRPSVSPERLSDELTHQRQFIDRMEIRFDASIGRVEMVLKSLLEGQANMMETLSNLHKVFEAGTAALPDEIAQLRRELVVVLQETNTSSRTVSQASVSPEPELPALDSIAAFTVWLVEQDVITLSELRIRLHPLDLLPSAVIDDINERALDLIGEPALEENGDNVIVQKNVLQQVIARWGAF